MIRKPWKALSFVGFYLVEVARANLELAYVVLSPKMKIQPGFIKVPLLAKTDVEILLVSNLVTMTPGTLSVDVSPDRTHLYVHSLLLYDPDNVKDEIVTKLQRRALEVLR